MRLVVMGTGPFMVPSFLSLLESKHSIACLVTQPVLQQRKGTPPPNPMRVTAEERGVPIWDPPSINEAAVIERLREVQADLFVVCDYGQILSEATLACSRLGGINLHGSLLPKYRGAAPVQWAVLQGEQETGVSVIHMTPRLDAGPCLCTASTAIGPRETAGELENRLAEIGVAAIHEAMEMLEQWDGTSHLGEVQDQELATKAPRLKKQHGAIDWQDAAAAIECRIRAFQPWPGTFTFWQDAPKSPLRLIVVSAIPVAETCDSEAGLIRVQEGQLDVATGQGWLRIERVKPAGKREMTSEEFIRGYRLASGHRFAAAAV